MKNVTLFSEKVPRERIFSCLPHVHEKSKDAVYQLMPLRKIYMKMVSGMPEHELDTYIREMYIRYVINNKHGLL